MYIQILMQQWDIHAWIYVYIYIYIVCSSSGIADDQFYTDPTEIITNYYIYLFLPQLQFLVLYTYTQTVNTVIRFISVAKIFMYVDNARKLFSVI